MRPRPSRQHARVMAAPLRPTLKAIVAEVLLHEMTVGKVCRGQT